MRATNPIISDDANENPGVVGRWCPLATGPPKVLCYEWNTEMRCEDCVIKKGADE